MTIIETISYFVLPIILLIVALIILIGKKDYFSSFLNGAKEGALSAVNLLPTLCALIVGVGMFSASGASEIISNALSPFLSAIGIPTEIFTLILTRPLSGGASLATYTDIIENVGVDSIAGLCASVIMASSDTVFYVISVYFSSSGIKKTRYALPVALFVSAFSVFLSCILCRAFFE